MKISPGQFLVSGDRLTAADVAERLNIIGGAAGTVIVLAVSNFTGWHSKAVWEWPTPRMGGGLAGLAAVLG